MKKNISFVFFILFVLLFGNKLSAQIALKAEMPQFCFLQYEPVYATITMRNLSGHPLAFGETAGLRGTLRFEISAIKDGHLARLLTSELPTLKGIILQPGTTRVFKYNVSAYYDLRKIGHYVFKAVISHPQLDSSYGSNSVQFSVVTGRNIWQTIVGVPKDLTDQVSSRIQTRRYRITTYTSGANFFYMLFIEDDRKIYLVTRLGLDMGYALRPQCAIDELSRLHLLVAASPKVFAYYQYNINGKLEHKEVRIKTNTTPRLVTNKDVGTVVLSGGRKARPETDYEEIKSLPFIEKALEIREKDITGGKKILDDKDDE